MNLPLSAPHLISFVLAYGWPGRRFLDEPEKDKQARRKKNIALSSAQSCQT
jgi:hypothetical protein